MEAMLGMTMARLQNILWLEIFWISYRSSKKCSWCDTVRLTRPGHSLACSIVPIISQHIHPSPSCHHISVCVHMFRVSNTPVHGDILPPYLLRVCVYTCSESPVHQYMETTDTWITQSQVHNICFLSSPCVGWQQLFVFPGKRRCHSAC